MVCEICGAEVNEQPVRIVDGRKDPDKRTNKPPPRRYAVAVIPFVCVKCGHEQFRRLRKEAAETRRLNRMRKEEGEETRHQGSWLVRLNDFFAWGMTDMKFRSWKGGKRA
jgi:hypothetical protein